MLNTKGMRFPIDVILVCIRRYAGYPLSHRHLEEIMQERGVFIDHLSINSWAIRFLPLLERLFHKSNRSVRLAGAGEWMKLKIRVKGVREYPCRALNKERPMVDFLLSAKRDEPALKMLF